MYALGFDLCRQAGVDCIWGFTSAQKPFAKVGFDVSGELFQEIVSWCRQALSRHPGGDRRVEPPALDPARSARCVARSKTGGDSADAHERYVRHRYLNNPARNLAFMDGETGALFSYGGAARSCSGCPRSSADRSRLEPALRAARRRWDASSWESSDSPIVRRSVETLPGSAYFRRKTPLRIVFIWLGPLSGTPVPDFDVEGYTKGVR